MNSPPLQLKYLYIVYRPNGFKSFGTYWVLIITFKVFHALFFVVLATIYPKLKIIDRIFVTLHFINKQIYYIVVCPFQLLFQSKNQCNRWLHWITRVVLVIQPSQLAEFGGKLDRTLILAIRQTVVAHNRLLAVFLLLYSRS